MRILIGSDIHLEFGGLDISKQADADVLILSGDICVAQDLKNFQKDYEVPASVQKDSGWIKANEAYKFFEDCAAKYKHVVYVMGNHEHYHGKFNDTESILRKRLSHIPNLFLLEKQMLVVDDVFFFGGTLWTDMNKSDPVTLQVIKEMMNDYVTVKFVEGEGDKAIYRKLSPKDTVAEHKAMLSFLDKSCETFSHEKIVVVGHHGPTPASIHPRYKHDVITNGAYSSDLSNFILDRPQIKLWTHGHTHMEHDYMVGGTRVVCNPRGYVHYERAGQEEEPYFFQYVEV